MSPHGGALWPREKAGHGGAGLHLSMGILFSKSCQRSSGRSVGQLTVVIAGEETKAGLKHAVFSREKNLCVSQARHSGSLHRSLLQSAFNRRRRRQQTGRCPRGQKITTRSTKRTFDPRLSPAQENMSLESYSALDESSLRALVSTWVEMQLNYWGDRGRLDFRLVPLTRHPHKKISLAFSVNLTLRCR